MLIQEITRYLSDLAHPSLQEPYDNAGLLTGDPGWECTGILCTLDCTEAVVEEAANKGLNLVVAHHPIIFGGLKQLNGKNYVERTVISAVRNDIAIYAIHTNLDAVAHGVNARLAARLGLINTRILDPKPGTLSKLVTFVPRTHAERVRHAMSEAGAGKIGLYDSCSFNAEGMGTFRPLEGAKPFSGKVGSLHEADEIRIEMLVPAFLVPHVLGAMKTVHPYEEVAYDIIPLANPHPEIGSGMIGELPGPLDQVAFLAMLAEKLRDQSRAGSGSSPQAGDNQSFIRHSALGPKPVSRVAICGGAGSFLIRKALAAGADAFVTADLKYHEFFDAEGRILLADPGHFETEQFTPDLLQEVLQEKFHTFAVLKSAVSTNPVFYY